MPAPAPTCCIVLAGSADNALCGDTPNTGEVRISLLDKNTGTNRGLVDTETNAAVCSGLVETVPIVDGEWTTTAAIRPNSFLNGSSTYLIQVISCGQCIFQREIYIDEATFAASGIACGDTVQFTEFLLAPLPGATNPLCESVLACLPVGQLASIGTADATTVDAAGDPIAPGTEVVNFYTPGGVYVNSLSASNDGFSETVTVAGGAAVDSNGGAVPLPTGAVDGDILDVQFDATGTLSDAVFAGNIVRDDAADCSYRVFDARGVETMRIPKRIPVAAVPGFGNVAPTVVYAFQGVFGTTAMLSQTTINLTNPNACPVQGLLSLNSGPRESAWRNEFLDMNYLLYSQISGDLTFGGFTNATTIGGNQANNPVRGGTFNFVRPQELGAIAIPGGASLSLTLSTFIFEYTGPAGDVTLNVSNASLPQLRFQGETI